MASGAPVAETAITTPVASTTMLMPANDRYARSMDVKLAEERRKIDAAMTAAVSRGETSAELRFVVSRDMCVELVRLGYKVLFADASETETWRSWREESETETWARSWREESETRVRCWQDGITPLEDYETCDKWQVSWGLPC